METIYDFCSIRIKDYSFNAKLINEIFKLAMRSMHGEKRCKIQRDKQDWANWALT